MFWFALTHLISFFVDLISIGHISERDKNLELLILRQQIRILQRKLGQRQRITRTEKLTLAVLTTRMKRSVVDSRSWLSESLLIFKPETILKWHRELVRRKWALSRKRSPGRKKIDPELETLIVRLARENPRWGYGKIHGELLKLSYSIGRSTVRDVLKRNMLAPVPTRGQKGGSWRTFLNHYKEQMLACDFFTVETAWLKTIYVLFFIEIGTRRVHLAGCTTNPTSTWVTQQARNLVWVLEDDDHKLRFLIHDRDRKFTCTFDGVLIAENIEVIQTPFRAPKANAFAERWVRSVREECLDQLLVLGQGHLCRVLREYVDYYNQSRPHQGLQQRTPVPITDIEEEGEVCRREVLGGIIHDYYRMAVAG